MTSDSLAGKNDKNDEKDYLREESLSKGGKNIANIFKSGHIKLNFDLVKSQIRHFLKSKWQNLLNIFVLEYKLYYISFKCHFKFNDIREIYCTLIKYLELGLDADVIIKSDRNCLVMSGGTE